MDNLRVAESQGICGTRMLLVPDPFAPAPESLWEDVLSTTWRSFDQDDVPPDALRFPIQKKISKSVSRGSSIFSTITTLMRAGVLLNGCELPSVGFARKRQRRRPAILSGSL
jgi:hypothetical protein